MAFKSETMQRAADYAETKLKTYEAAWTAPSPFAKIKASPVVPPADSKPRHKEDSK